MKKIFLIIGFAFLFWQCSNSSNITDNPLEGEITITADESLQPIVDAQIMAYTAHYPKAKINIKYLPEQRAMSLMMKDSAEIAIITREFTTDEKQFFDNKKIKYLPAKMALDGVALITNLDNQLSRISLQELKAMFEGKSQKDIKLVFDNSSSSNLNVMMEKLGVSDLSKANIFAANGNLDAIDYIKKSKKAIGVIGNNWFCDKKDPQSQELLKSIKLLEVSKDGKDYFKPTFSNLKKRQYPLERKILLHTKQHYGMTNGFIRFCCSQVGQLVVEKAGLLPYYNFSKELLIEKKSVQELQKDKETSQK